MEQKLSPTKVDVLSFYQKTYETWKEGKVLEFNPNSKVNAEESSLQDFIKLIQELSGEKLQEIAERFGFFKDEIFLFAKPKRLILTNKRYFISDSRNKELTLDAYSLDKIKNIKKNGIFNLIIALQDGSKIDYRFSGDWITMEGVEKAMQVIPSQISQNDNLDFLKEPNDNVDFTENIQDEIEYWECFSCGTLNILTSNKCSNSKCGKTSANIEVKIDDQIKEYLSTKEFENEIKKRKYEVSIAILIRKKISEKKEWQTLTEFSKGSKLEKYITPIWTYAKEYIYYGILFIIIIKALDTAIFMFTVDVGLGLFWIGSIFLFGGMFFNKLSGLFAILGIIFMQIKFGVQFNVFVSFITLGLIGFIFGTPLGLIAGTIVGLFRVKQGKILIDAPAESRTVLIKGLLIPLVVLSVLLILYFYVINPLIINWISS